MDSDHYMTLSVVYLKDDLTSLYRIVVIIPQIHSDRYR